MRQTLASGEPPKYSRPPRGPSVGTFEPRIRELLARFPDMPETAIAERVGWTGAITVSCGRVAQLRPLFRPPGMASPTLSGVGGLAQCDLWSPPVDIPVEFSQVARLPVLTMTSGYSRLPGAVITPAQHADDVIAGHWEVSTVWGAGSASISTLRSQSCRQASEIPKSSAICLIGTPFLQHWATGTTSSRNSLG